MSESCKDSRKSIDKLLNNSKFVSLVKQIVKGTPCHSSSCSTCQCS